MCPPGTLQATLNTKTEESCSLLSATQTFPTIKLLSYIFNKWNKLNSIEVSTLNFGSQILVWQQTKKKRQRKEKNKISTPFATVIHWFPLQTFSSELNNVNALSRKTS